MKIILQQKKLANAVQITERVVSKNTSLPILTAILLKAEGGRLQLTATNLEIGVRCWVGAKVEHEGSIAVPARVFSDFINSVTDEKITLTSEKQVLQSVSEHSKTQILGMKPDEFPIIPTLTKTTEVALSGAQLRTALLSVFDATSLLETRPELSGVYVHTEANAITFAATDSFRLAEYILPAKPPAGKSFIIPRTTVLEMIRIVTDHPEEIILAVSENQISLKGSDVELVSRLIDGRYPDYKKVIPEKFTTTLTVAKDELERAVRMASIFSSSISDLHLHASNGVLQLVAKNSDKGEIVSDVAISSVPAPFDISVNYRYLLDGLKVIPTKNVVIGYTGPGNPLALKGENHDQQVYVIMPLRT